MSVGPTQSRWIAKPRRVRWGISLFALSLAMTQFVTRGIVIARHQRTTSFLEYLLIVASLVFILVFAAFWLRDLFRRRMTDEDRVVMDGGFGDQFPVEVTFTVRGIRLGIDRGVLWFSDGLIGFSGEAAAFVLSADDLFPPRPGSQGDSSMAFRNAPKEGCVDVRPLGKTGRAYQKRLRQFFYDWDRTDGERFWPPLSPYGASGDDALSPDGARERVQKALRDRLEDAGPLEDDVDGGALGVRQLDQR